MWILVTVTVGSNWFWTKLNEINHGNISSCKQFCHLFYFIHFHVSFVPLLTTQVLVILLSKNITLHVNLTSLIHNSSRHQVPCNATSSLHPRFQWSSSSQNFNDQFLNKYPTNASVSLVPNPRCHNLYVCKLWWLKYDYFPHKSMGEISVPLPVALSDEDYCSSLHQFTGGVVQK